MFHYTQDILDAELSLDNFMDVFISRNYTFLRGWLKNKAIYVWYLFNFMIFSRFLILVLFLNWDFIFNIFIIPIFRS